MSNAISFDRLGYNLMTPELIEDEFVEAALGKLPEILEESERKCLDSILRQCYNDRFTVSDAARLARHTEHVNPELSEDYACKVIGELIAKYVPQKCKNFLGEI